MQFYEQMSISSHLITLHGTEPSQLTSERTPFLFRSLTKFLNSWTFTRPRSTLHKWIFSSPKCLCVRMSRQLVTSLVDMLAMSAAEMADLVQVQGWASPGNSFFVTLRKKLLFKNITRVVDEGTILLRKVSYQWHSSRTFIVIIEKVKKISYCWL